MAVHVRHIRNDNSSYSVLLDERSVLTAPSCCCDRNRYMRADSVVSPCTLRFHYYLLNLNLLYFHEFKIVFVIL